ncbi:MAG: hypothetical protein HC801_02330, partial [Nitrospira sp.]|nr:hypothetical protein [Nitrospira sp.]
MVSFTPSVVRPTLFPLLLGRVGVRCFSQTPVSVRFRTAASSLAAVVFLSAFLHLETTGVPTLTSGMISRGMAGGAVGQTIAEGLRAVFAGTGAHILIIAGFLVSFLLTTPLSLAEVIRRMPERWATLCEGVFAMMPERSVATQKEAVTRKIKVKTQKLAQTSMDEEDFAGSLHTLEPSPPVSVPIIQPFPLSTLAVEENVIEPEVVVSQTDSEDY